MKNNTEIKVGSSLPSKKMNEKEIYELLSKNHWTLIVCGKEKIKINKPQLKILHVPEGTYSSRYILINTDWHIAMADQQLIESDIIKLIE